VRLQLSGPCGTRVTIKSRAAIVMLLVAIQTSVKLARPLTRLCMTFLSEPSSAIRTIRGGATTPLITAVMSRSGPNRPIFRVCAPERYPMESAVPYSSPNGVVPPFRSSGEPLRLFHP
jgi:hypothetical protein